MAPRREIRAWFGLVAAFVSCVSLGAALGSCGASGVDAPPLPADQVQPASKCRSIQTYMPEFFTLLRDPRQPLKGLRDVVASLTNGGKKPQGGDPIAGVLTSTIQGLLRFTKDPPESDDSPDGCHPATDHNPLPASLGLCEVDVTAAEHRAGTPCENRMCSIKRAIDFGVRDQGAKAALDALRPMLEKLLGYITNTKPGGDGVKEHYEGIAVLNGTANDPGLCTPDNLIEVIDGLVVYFRVDPGCFDDRSCVGLRALSNLKALVTDPAIDAFLLNFEGSQGDGKGRAAFQKLANVLIGTLQGIPADETYFDQVDSLVDRLLIPFFDSDPDKYGGLRMKTLEAVAMAKGLLDPAREGAILVPLQSVLKCVAKHDPDGELVGIFYDLLSKPGGVDANGLDLVELIEAFDDLAQLDREGVLFGALHTVLATMLTDEQSMTHMNDFLAQVLTVENAKLVTPVVKTMVERGVLDELVDVIDNLIFGCKGSAT